MTLDQRKAQRQALQPQWWELKRRRAARQQRARDVRLGLNPENREPLVVPIEAPPTPGTFQNYDDEPKRQGAEFFRTLHLRLERRWD